MRKWMLMLLLLSLCGCSQKPKQEVLAEESHFTQSGIREETQMTTEAPMDTEPKERVEMPLFSQLINPQDGDFVRVSDYIPEAVIELKYAAQDNFTGQVIYDFQDVFLRYGTVMKLKAVSEELSALGIGIKIWDGFRPVSAQFKLWEVCPDPTYVANPTQGYSNHSRGFAVDLTLTDENGRELEMPTGFDDFSSLADRDYSDCNPEAAENARLLETVMEEHGFQGYWGEWWHFNDTTRYDVESAFDPARVERKTLLEETELLRNHGEESSVLLSIPAGQTVTFLSEDGALAMVEYWGYRGYVPKERLK